MKGKPLIRFTEVAQKDDDEQATPAVPAAYGQLLLDIAASKGLQEEQLAEVADLSSVTIWRLKSGKGSARSAANVRAILIGRGASVPPIPLGDLDWQPSPEQAPRPQHTPTPTGSDDEATIRRNLVRFREQAGYDQFAAATAAGLTYETLNAYETGTAEIPGAVLRQLATPYGRRPGHFFEADPPAPDLSEVPAVRVVVRPGVQLSVEDRAQLDAAVAAVNARHRHRQRSHRADAAPKRRKTGK